MLSPPREDKGELLQERWEGSTWRAGKTDGQDNHKGRASQI